MKVFKSITSIVALFLLLSGILCPSFAQQVEQVAYRVAAHTSGSVSGEVQEKPYKSEFFRVRGIPKVTVHTTTGDIEVFQNPEIDGVMVDLYLERSFSLWSGRRSLDNYRIILQQQGDHIIASVEDKKSGPVAGSRDIKFHFVVQTPAKISSNLRTLDGDIFLEDVEGHHFVQNQSGNVVIRRTSGEIRAVSTLGDIGLEHLEGNIFAKTVNGSVNVFSNSGEVRVRTVSGNIIASNINGTLVSATTSGDIFADFQSVSKGIYLKTLSGNVELLLPTTNGYNFEGSAMSYDFEGFDDEIISQRYQNHRELNVVIREGGLPVRVTTMSGRVRVAESQE